MAHLLHAAGFTANWYASTDLEACQNARLCFLSFQLVFLEFFEALLSFSFISFTDRKTNSYLNFPCDALPGHKQGNIYAATNQVTIVGETIIKSTSGLCNPQEVKTFHILFSFFMSGKMSFLVMTREGDPEPQ